MKTEVRALATIRLTLVLAQRSDVIDDFGNWRAGIMYFIRSNLTGKFDGHPFYISDETNKEDFAAQHKNKMIYVARNPFDAAAVSQEVKQINLVNQARADLQSA